MVGEIPVDIKNLSNLIRLDVSGIQNLETLPIVLGDMKKLGEIIFDNERLGMLPNLQSFQVGEKVDDIMFDYTMANIKKTSVLKEYLKELSNFETKQWDKGHHISFS